MYKIVKFFKKNFLIILLAFVPPFAIWFFFQRDTKDIEISVLSNVPVVSIQKEFSKGIEVQFQKKAISSLQVIEIKVQNSGNRPIERIDFDSPIKLLFKGKILPPVEVVSLDPPNLPAEVETSDQYLTIKPMLLNRGDSFVLRTFVADETPGGPPVQAISRIKGIKKINLTESESDKNRRRSFVLGILSGLFASLSFTALITLFWRARRLVVSLPGGIGFELTQLDQRGDATKKISELAERLQISRHDFKSNLLLLRLKIEEQLRELARGANLGLREQVGSLSRLSRILKEKGLIDNTVESLIQDISPVMNRELHESESYLTEDEFAELQRVALSIVVALEAASNALKQNLA